MKQLFLGLSLFVSVALANAQRIPQFRNGDIILQTSLSSQSQAIQQATHSKWSHVGVIQYRGGVGYVYEAHGPVGFRSLQAFVNSGSGKRFMVRRLKGGLSGLQMQALYDEGARYRGKPYDIYFDWDDSEIYCSELVWKMYSRGIGVSVGERQALRDMDLSSPLVQRKLHERYGNNIPYNETVVTPAAIAVSSKLVTVYAN